MTEAEAVVRVLLADEQSLFREAMKIVLGSQEDLEVVGEARDGMQAVAEVERVRPDVALLDAGLPNFDGIRATALIAERAPDCQVIVLSAQEDERVLVRAMEAGASGYLSKASPMSDLIEAARAVHRGEALVPPRMLGALLKRLVQRRRERDDALKRMGSLTRREREVLALVADGADNEGIAQELVISPETARTHVQNVLGKLGVHSRLEAAAFVTQNGIMDDLVGAGS
ncbi:MAG TPA: response regulator transcription factor [Actinomycetota bacterium]|nr:response regulator transcription factor [Actinomycetota bacterium]